jgi:hypothetical protein
MLGLIACSGDARDGADASAAGEGGVERDQDADERDPDAEAPESGDAGSVQADAAQSDASNTSRMDGSTPRDAGAEAGSTDAGRLDAATSDSGGVTGDGGSAATGGLVFVSVGGAANVPWLYTSCDGRLWDRRPLGLTDEHPLDGEGRGLRGVAYGAGIFVITGGGSVPSGNVRILGRSEDGLNWQWEERASFCTDCEWMGGAAFLDNGQGGIWIAGGGSGTRLYSRNGARSWQQSSAQGIAPYRRFRSLGARAAGAGQGVLTLVELAPAGSSEPVVWHDSAQPTHESVFLAAGNGAFVAVWYNDGCRFLRDGTTWRTCTLPAGRDPVLTSVVFGNGKFSILGHGAPLESTDGEHWTIAPSGSGTDFRDVTYAEGTYATPISYSSDARSWTPAALNAHEGFAMAAGRLAAGRSCPRN